MINIDPCLTNEERNSFQEWVDQNIIRKEKDRYQIWINNVRSNLSVKDYITSLSKEFIKRSQETHLTDTLWNPLVVRHGSFIQFDVFEKNPNGIFFCDLSHAIEYAKTRLEQEVWWYNIDNYKISLYQCFIKAKSDISAIMKNIETLMYQIFGHNDMIE